MRAGDKVQAVRHYRRSLELNPGNDNAEAVNGQRFEGARTGEP